MLEFFQKRAMEAIVLMAVILVGGKVSYRIEKKDSFALSSYAWFPLSKPSAAPEHM